MKSKKIECARCDVQLPREMLSTVPMLFRILGVPLILLNTLKRSPLGSQFEFFALYCVRCRQRQILSYSIAGIWTLGLVAYLGWKWVTGNNLEIR